MDYDDILVELGEFGPWQMMVTAMLWIPAVVDGIMTLVASYTSLQPKAYRCNIPGCDDEQNFNYSAFPVDLLFPNNKSSGQPDFCQYYRPVQLTDGSCTQKMSSEVESCGSESTYTYQDFSMDRTLVTEFHLVCDPAREVWVPIFNSCFMLGLALGSLIFGVLSDKLGRRHTLLLAILTCTLPSVVASQAPTFQTYAILRVLVGAGSEGCFIVAFAMVLEITGSREEVPYFYWVSYLTLHGNLMSIPFAIGEVTVSLVAMLLPDWRWLELCLALICLLSSFLWFVIPESPRWLISQGRLADAKGVLVKAAARNGVSLSPHLLRDGSEEGGEEAGEAPPQYGLLDLFRSECVMVTLALFLIWPIITLLYYGLTFSADKIQITENTYSSFIAISLIELPPVLLLILLMDIWGRKPLMATSLIIPGICCMAAGFLEEGAAFTFFVLLGKFCAAGAFNIAHIVTAELYPTSIRNSVLGACSTIARIGGISAPWIAVYLPDQGSFSPSVALYIFGSTSLVAGLAALLLLTETLGSPLPDDFEDVQQMKKDAKPIWKCIWPERDEEAEEDEEERKEKKNKKNKKKKKKEEEGEEEED